MAFLLCFCLGFLPKHTQATSTANAKEPIATYRECTLTICYGYEDTAFSGQRVLLYQVADVSAQFQYALRHTFASSGLRLNGVQTNGEWNTIRSTLEAYILSSKVQPTEIGTTNDLGQVCFTGLKPGLYLASGMQVSQDASDYVFDSALIALPGLGTDGLWQYEVSVAAKGELLPPTDLDAEIQLKVLKLWKGDQGLTDRPKSIEVEIFCNGVCIDTVTLSEKNHWSYSWTTKEVDAGWNVVERNVPSGYVMTVEPRQTTFVITNTRSDQPTPPPAQTGDTTNVLLYMVLMFVSGSMLILLGITGKRRRYE